jgi:Trypsin-co-occurring domain 1
MGTSRSATHSPPEILLEVRPATVSGDLAPRALVPEEFKNRAAEIADSIGEVVDQFRARLGKVLARSEDTSWSVGSVEIAFDIAVQAEAGVIIARTSAGATFSARLVLQAPQAPQKPQDRPG